MAVSLFRLFLLSCCLWACASATAITLYSPISYGAAYQYLNVTYKVTSGTCTAGTVRINVYSRNSSSSDRIVVGGGTSLTNYLRVDTTNITGTSVYNTTTTYLPNGVYDLDVCCMSSGSMVCGTRVKGFHIVSACSADPTVTGYGATPSSGCLTCSSNYVQTSIPCQNCTSGWFGPFCNISAAVCRQTRCNGHAECTEKDDLCGPCDNHYSGTYCEVADGKSAVTTSLIVSLSVVGGLMLLGGAIAVLMFGSKSTVVAPSAYSSVDPE